MRRIIMISLTVAVIVAAAVFYYFLDPSSGGWLIRCPFKLLTGLDCPSCGLQRALHALLHGEFRAALAFNPFLILSIPFLICVIWSTFLTLPGGRIMHKITHSRLAVYSYMAAFMLWWVIRNIIGI